MVKNRNRKQKQGKKDQGSSHASTSGARQMSNWHVGVQTLYRDGDLPMYEFLFASPSRRKERIRKRSSTTLSENQFLTLHLLIKNIQIFKIRSKNRGYPDEFWANISLKVNLTGRERSLEYKEISKHKKILPFVYVTNTDWLYLTLRTQW